VRGQHGAYKRIGEPRRDPLPVDAVVRDALQRIGKASPLRRRASQSVRPAAAVLVDVLGDVDEMREVAERADDVERLRDRKVGEERFEFLLDSRAWSSIARRNLTAVCRIASIRA
jgi:hypothetical protein